MKSDDSAEPLKAFLENNLMGGLPLSMQPADAALVHKTWENFKTLTPTAATPLDKLLGARSKHIFDAVPKTWTTLALAILEDSHTLSL